MAQRNQSQDTILCREALHPTILCREIRRNRNSSPEIDKPDATENIQHLDKQTDSSVCPRTRPAYLSVQELDQRHQFLLVEIKSNTPQAEIPQLDQLFLQTVSEDLQKKLLVHLLPLPTTTNYEQCKHPTTLGNEHATPWRWKIICKQLPTLQIERRIGTPNHAWEDRLHNRAHSRDPPTHILQQTEQTRPRSPQRTLVMLESARRKERTTKL
jgi:hypothetical protein